MKAIQRLRKSGMSRVDIAKAIGASRQAVGLWERCKRSPNHDSREALIELALSRGITLLASDFSMAADEDE